MFIRLLFNELIIIIINLYHVIYLQLFILKNVVYVEPNLHVNKNKIHHYLTIR